MTQFIKIRGKVKKENLKDGLVEIEIDVVAVPEEVGKMLDKHFPHSPIEIGEMFTREAIINSIVL